MSEPPAVGLIQQARQAEHHGRFDQARDLLRQAAGRTEDPSLHLDANLRLGKLLVEGGAPCHGEAEVVLGAARVRAEQEGAQRQAASALHLLALLQRRRGNLNGTQELLDQSGGLRLAEAPGPEVGQLLHYRGLVLADRNELAQAERLEGVTKRYPGCDIIISEKTQQGQQAYHVAETELGDDEELKGRNEKVRIYLVRGLLETSSKQP